MDLNRKHIIKVLLFMYIHLELGPSIQRLHFGDNTHVEIIHSEVHGHIWSVVAYVRDEEWMNVQLPPANLNLVNVYYFELVNDSNFQG